jgi:hypothetical protein
VSRWAFLKDLAQRWAPYISAILILIFAGVIIYFIMKTALGMYGDIVAARTAECARFLINPATPAVPAS